MFYLKLAWSNLKKNRTTYLPFLGSMMFLVFLNLLMQVMVNNPGMQNLPQAMTVHSMFSFGVVVILVFSVIFSFYTNSFLIKRRQKELGLYNILGMDKKSLGWMLLIESLLSLVISLVIGIGLGSILAKFLFLVMKKMTGFGEDFVFQLSFQMLLFVTVVFAGIFLLLLLHNYFQLWRTKPIELLHGSDTGEKEPKAHWLLTIIGFAAIAAGYLISVLIESPVAALPYFFVAIVLVIIGTYLVMMTGSITVLKALRKRPQLYYQPKPFINISGMIYRMKQNGAGLASICILSTMVLVTVSSTAGLYFGKENVLETRNPSDISLTTQTVNHDLAANLNALAVENQVTVTEMVELDSPNISFLKEEGNNFVPVNDTQEFDGVIGVEFLTAADYQQLTGKTIDLKDNKLVFYPISGDYEGQTIYFGEQSYDIRERLEDLPMFPKNPSFVDTFFFFVKDQSVVEKIYADLNLGTHSSYQPLAYDSEVMMNLEGSQANLKNFATAVFAYQEQLNQAANQDLLPNPSMNYASATSIEVDREETNGFTGGFLFIGIIFGLSFTLATALIIYYKQISEGYEDTSRFEIMQKVGMSRKEVRQTISSQVLMVFLLPLSLAVIHLAFALPIIRKLLILFGLTNSQLITIVTILSVIVFAICYLFVYWQTSKVYYRLVERKV
ncbi:ABC transporter permease [Enterococcus sp. LJL120]